MSVDISSIDAKRREFGRVSTHSPFRVVLNVTTLRPFTRLIV